MKKAMKTLPLAIAFALLAAFIPLLSGGGMTARADGDFTIENGVLKKYNGSGGYVVVPDGVKTIDERAFYNNLTITGVRLPDSVMQIKSFAFYACANLKEATLPSDLRTIGTSAFYECNLQPLTLSVKATGSGLKYQWYFKKTSQSAFSVWNGHTHATETCTPNDTWNGIRLYCRVTDGGGNKINSDEATVTLASALAITTQPTSKTVTLGESVTLSLKATGEGLTYQWYYKKKGASSFTLWSGRTHAIETVTPNATWDGIQLYCIVKDGSGNTKQSNTITVTVKTVPVITTQPTNKTVNLGDSLTLSLKATGEGLTYQWYFRKKGQSDFSVWNGHTKATETCTPNATWDGIQLYCVVRNSAGNTTKSNTITVTVKIVPVITTQPTNQTVTAGNSITLSLKASGTGLTYQWYFKKAGQTSFSVWNGRTHASETVSPNSTWNGIQLYCVVTDSAGKTAQSSTITVTVK